MGDPQNQWTASMPGQSRTPQGPMNSKSPSFNLDWPTVRSSPGHCRRRLRLYPLGQPQALTLAPDRERRWLGAEIGLASFHLCISIETLFAVGIRVKRKRIDVVVGPSQAKLGHKKAPQWRGFCSNSFNRLIDESKQSCSRHWGLTENSADAPDAT